jgi:serine/threonine-protein kinase
MESQAVLEALARVLGSEGFTRNERQSQFLRFLVEGELSGQHRDLKESVLAVEVFGRRADYDPRVDGIVRTEALRLRARLAKYYEAEGRDDAVVIELPKGGYRPVFQEGLLRPPARLVTQRTMPPTARRHPMENGAFLGLAAIVVATLGAIWASGFAPLRRPTPRSELAPISFVIPPAPGTMWDVYPPDPRPAVSPDGRYVAVVTKSSDGLGVWLHDVQSGSAILLANTGSHVPSPFWAPDSTAVAFCDPAGVRVIGIASRAANRQGSALHRWFLAPFRWMALDQC